MAFKIDVRHSFEWPDGLARRLDVDGAFRRAACLAVARVCEMCRGHSTTASGWEFVNPANPESVDAHEVMFDCFRWDGGTETIDEIVPGSVWSVTASPGADLFRDVPARQDVRASGSGLSPQEIIELLAEVGGAPSKCLASKYPYRMWWRAFNRAVYRLTNDIEYEATVKCDSYYSLAHHYRDVTYHVYPMCLAYLPDMTRALTPDDLCVDWTPSTEWADVVKVPPNTPWLMTPGDIDFGTHWFGTSGSASGYLRYVWMTLASSIGFTNLASPSAAVVGRPVFFEGASNWWHGKTGPKLTDDRTMLRQLYVPWTGSYASWKGEFPYHGFAAQVAVLDYLETCNIGFALTDDEARPNSASHNLLTSYCRASSEVRFTPTVGSEGSPVRVVPDEWTEDTSSQWSSSEDRSPEASRTCTANGGIVLTASVSATVEWTTDALVKYSSGNHVWSVYSDSLGLFREYAESVSSQFPYGDPAVFERRLNAIWRGVIEAGEAEGRATFGFTSTFTEVDPVFSVSDKPRFFYKDSVAEGAHPYLAGGAAVDCAYLFFQTLFRGDPKRAAIVKVPSGDSLYYDDILLPELDLMGCRHMDESDLPRPGPQDPEAFVQPVSPNPFRASQTDELINISGGEWGHPTKMVTISFNGVTVFPPNVEVPPGSAYVDVPFEMPRLTYAADVSCEDPNLYEEFSGYTKVLIERALFFLKYPRNVIYPASEPNTHEDW